MSNASGSDLPDMIKNSKTLSKLPESEQLASTIGNSLLMFSPKCADAATPSRAFIALTLPNSVLISPLWLINLFG